MRKFGPKSENHPSVGEPCPVCRKPFLAGDFTTLEFSHAATREDAARAQEGLAYTGVAIEVHWDCRSGRPE